MKNLSSLIKRMFNKTPIEEKKLSIDEQIVALWEKHYYAPVELEIGSKKYPENALGN